NSAPAANSSGPYLIVLSAQSEPGLRQRQRDLFNWLGQAPSNFDLRDVSATLALGRKHFPQYRSAWIASDSTALQEALQIYSDHPAERSGALRNNAAVSRLIPLLVEEANKLTGEARAESLHALAELYRMGYDLEWRSLFRNEPFRRIALPAYPFTRNRYW